MLSFLNSLRRVTTARSVPWAGPVGLRVGTGLLQLHILLDVQRDLVVIRHARIRVANLGQIGRSRPSIQEAKHGVVAVLFLEFGNLAVRVHEIAENNRFSRASLLAGGL